MFRNNKYPSFIEHINCLLANGGLGDILCALPAVNFIHNTYPYVKLHVWVPDFMLDFCKNVLPKELIIRDFSTGKKKYNENLTGISCQWLPQCTSLRKHPVEHSYIVMCDMIPNNEQKSYLKFDSSKVNISKFKLPEKYVVIPLGHTAKPKEFRTDLINSISDYVLSNGYTPVYVGKEQDTTGVDGIDLKAVLQPIDYIKGINLCNKTSLIELAAIIDKAALVIGMDGGTIHLAGFTDTPIIAAYTFIRASQGMPYRNGSQEYKSHIIEPPSSLECRGCQSKWAYLYDHDYRNCFYDDYKCVEDLSFEQFKEGIDKFI
jgi:ADP-heptose:LPS heptosyltransferase